MCDTVCAVGEAGVLFGKNSDREAGEAQVVELHPARTGLGGDVRCTHLAVPQVARTRAVILSRPAWMWGCEMGANDAGVVAGNEAVFTRVPVADAGLTGMDVMRLALERAGSARECVDVAADLLARFPQGGRMMLRDTGFRYHSSIVFADAREAWVMETAGAWWAAERMRGVRSISNALTIGVPDLVHPGAADEARRRGWLARGREFDFARCFADPKYAWVSGAPQRRACTTRALGAAAARAQGVDAASVMAALRDHGGRAPTAGLRSEAVCSHAAWLPTRHMGQTSGSMVSRLTAGEARHWLTGTAAPCLSVFKPVTFDVASEDLGPAPSVRADDASVFWRHERLHRAVLRDYAARAAVSAREREALEARVAAGTTAHDVREAWAAHRDAIPGWTARVEVVPAPRGGVPQRVHDAWWDFQSRRDGLREET